MLQKAEDHELGLRLLPRAGRAGEAGPRDLPLVDAVDDMLAPPAVSRRVEELRVDDPYCLTSVTLGMGSLLSEGSEPLPRPQRRLAPGADAPARRRRRRAGASGRRGAGPARLRRPRRRARGVHARPRARQVPHVFRRMLDHPCWELVLLRLKAGARRGRPAASLGPSESTSSAEIITRRSSSAWTTTTSSRIAATGRRCCRRSAAASTTAPGASTWAWALRSRSAASVPASRSVAPTCRPRTTPVWRSWPASRPTPGRRSPPERAG
jgi:hypothetical protein